MTNALSWRIGYADKPRLPYERVAKLGIRHVEILWPDGMTPGDVKKLLEPYGIKVATLTTPCDLAQPGVFDTLDQFAARAAELGTRVLFASVKSEGIPFDEACLRLRRIGDIVAKHGVRLGMETHMPLCHNGDVARRTLEGVNHPNIGLNFDTGNVYYYNQNVNGLAELEKVAPYVVSVHLKDTMGGYRDNRFPIFGEGVVDFAGVLRALKNVHFGGPFTMELEGPVFRAESDDEMEQKVAACLAHLKSVGYV